MLGGLNFNLRTKPLAFIEPLGGYKKGRGQAKKLIRNLEEQGSRRQSNFREGGGKEVKQIFDLPGG